MSILSWLMIYKGKPLTSTKYNVCCIAKFKPLPFILCWYGVCDVSSVQYKTEVNTALNTIYIKLDLLFPKFIVNVFSLQLLHAWYVTYEIASEFWFGFFMYKKEIRKIFKLQIFFILFLYEPCFTIMMYVIDQLFYEKPWSYAFC